MLSHFQIQIFRFQDAMSTVPDTPAKSPEQKDPLTLGVELYPMILEGEKSFPN